MKKIWIILLMLILVIIISLVVILLKRKQLQLTIDNIESMHFSYSTGNMIYSNVQYKIDKKNKKYIATIKPDGLSDEDKKEIEIDEKILEKIVNILNKYDISSWNNFHRYAKDILDGNSFSFYLKTKDNQIIDASGYMLWPKNYSTIRNELDKIFNNLY